MNVQFHDTTPSFHSNEFKQNQWVSVKQYGVYFSNFFMGCGNHKVNNL